MKHAVILNPVAGHRAGRRNRRKIERLLTAAGLIYEIFETRHENHAVELSRQASAFFDRVVAVGGDGTIQETARGILESGTNRPLAIIPSGTGNDLVKMLGVPTRIEKAVRTVATGIVAEIDYGKVTWESDAGKAERCFFNAIGYGFDASVAREVARLKFLPGPLAYLAAALRALRKWQTPHISVEVLEPGGEWLSWYEGPSFLVTIGNGRCSGGGFYLTPDASVRDGMLNACLVTDIPTRRVLRLMPKAMRGTHAGEREVRMRRVTRAQINADSDLPLHADGEICSTGTRSISVEIIASGLSVVVPSPEKIT